MLYLDSSVLIKRYVRERGTLQVEARMLRGDRLFTSALSYAEVHAVLGRKFREKNLSETKLQNIRDRFLQDWQLALNILDVDPDKMNAIPDLVRQHSVRGADAVHLASAIWLSKQGNHANSPTGGDSTLEFGVADKVLANVAARCGLSVFNPETET